MRINDMPFEDSIPIEGYGPNMFRVGGKVHDGAMLLLGSEVKSWGGYEDLEPLLALAGQVDFIIVGTGPEMTHLPAAFKEALEKTDIGLEPMASATACRSYNVLASEGRRVAVALLPV